MGFIGKMFDKFLDSMNEDPSRKWAWLMKHDGIIELRGKWETKEVFVYNKQLTDEGIKKHLSNNEGDVVFNWGVEEDLGAFDLSFAILLEFLSPEDALSYTKDFRKDFIAKLPQNDFETEINLEFWRNKILTRLHLQKGKKIDKYGMPDDDDNFGVDDSD